MNKVNWIFVVFTSGLTASIVTFLWHWFLFKKQKEKDFWNSQLLHLYGPLSVHLKIMHIIDKREVEIRKSQETLQSQEGEDFLKDVGVRNAWIEEWWKQADRIYEILEANLYWADVTYYDIMAKFMAWYKIREVESNKAGWSKLSLPTQIKLKETFIKEILSSLKKMVNEKVELLQKKIR
ncbi:MAG: hypothetical protein Q7J67_09025 [bacterium]|nr:hypothetical protein [bacterium]